jgi:hypothetical protein
MDTASAWWTTRKRALMDAPRRVVTGTDSSGKAMFVSDGPAPRTHAYASLPTMRSTIVWATGTDAQPTSVDPTPGLDRDIPAFGETRMIVVSFPPETAFADPDLDLDALAADDRIATPMLAELFESDAPGMHRSPTIDYAIVIEGEIYLELDHGAMTLLHPGDIVVQNATRHRWRNPTDRPCTIAYTWIGIGPATA